MEEMFSTTLITCKELEVLRKHEDRLSFDETIAAGPWVKGVGELPHRVVMRVQRGCYVVHVQVLDKDSVYYIDGTYFNTSNHFDEKTGPDASAAFKKAWACFVKRATSHLGLPAL